MGGPRCDMGYHRTLSHVHLCTPWRYRGTGDIGDGGPGASPAAAAGAAAAGDGDGGGAARTLSNVVATILFVTQPWGSIFRTFSIIALKAGASTPVPSSLPSLPSSLSSLPSSGVAGRRHVPCRIGFRRS